MNALVSTVIPTRNRPALVLRAVRSALSQTYAELEVIVVVDGPDAATVDALEALKEPRLRVVALTDNVGGSEARNIGVQESRGSWIALLDDDDEWLPEKIEKQMAARPDAAALYCLVTSRRLQREAGHIDVVHPRRLPRPGEDISEYMFYSGNKERHACGPQTSSFFATKQLFLDVPFSKGLKCHQDWDWYLRAMRKDGTVATMIEEPLYIMDVEPERPRMTQQARLELSLNWVESRRNIFTPRAYTSFLIHEIMFRCEDTGNRFQMFRRLVTLCRKSTRLTPRDMFAIVKWYLFRPSVRIRLVGYYKQLRFRLSGDSSNSGRIETPPTKLGVHG